MALVQLRVSYAALGYRIEGARLLAVGRYLEVRLLCLMIIETTTRRNSNDWLLISCKNRVCLEQGLRVYVSNPIKAQKSSLPIANQPKSLALQLPFAPGSHGSRQVLHLTPSSFPTTLTELHVIGHTSLTRPVVLKLQPFESAPRN